MKLGDQGLIRWASTEDPVEVVDGFSSRFRKLFLKTNRPRARDNPVTAFAVDVIDAFFTHPRRNVALGSGADAE